MVSVIANSYASSNGGDLAGTSTCRCVQRHSPRQSGQPSRDLLCMMSSCSGMTLAVSHNLTIPPAGLVAADPLAARSYGA
jgi:hypothetical protein